MPSINHILLLAMGLFLIGLSGVLIRKNLIVLFMSIELMMNSALLIVLAGATLHQSIDGVSFAFFIILIAAVEAVVGLALIFLLKKLGGNIDIINQQQIKKS